MSIGKSIVSLSVVAVLLAGGAVAGCEKKTSEKAADSMNRAGDNARDAADRVGDKTKDAADRVGDKMSDAGDKVKDAVK